MRKTKKYVVIDAGVKILKTRSYSKAEKLVEKRNKNKKHPRAYLDEEREE